MRRATVALSASGLQRAIAGLLKDHRDNYQQSQGGGFPANTAKSGQATAGEMGA